jgi:protein-disulfide isomerase
MLRIPISSDDHSIGPARAPVTLVEYGDYQCQHCLLAHNTMALVLPQFDQQVRYVFRHFPMTEVHPYAGSAAEGAEFAGAHGRFWEMHDGLFKNQDRLDLPLLFALVRALNLSEIELRDALETRRFAAKVRNDFLGGARSGVNGTPTFFINGRRHDGSYAYEELTEAIDLHLQAAATS